MVPPICFASEVISFSRTRVRSDSGCRARCPSLSNGPRHSQCLLHIVPTRRRRLREVPRALGALRVSLSKLPRRQITSTIASSLQSGHLTSLWVRSRRTPVRRDCRRGAGQEKRAGSPCVCLRGVERLHESLWRARSSVTADQRRGQRRLSRISSRTMAIPKKTAPCPLGPRLGADPLPSHVALRAARRSMRSAISWLLIDPPHTHENSASSSLERSKNRCASATLLCARPAWRKILSWAASANAEAGCEIYFH
jgi:hypothetical protein